MHCKYNTIQTITNTRALTFPNSLKSRTERKSSERDLLTRHWNKSRTSKRLKQNRKKYILHERATPEVASENKLRFPIDPLYLFTMQTCINILLIHFWPASIIGHASDHLEESRSRTFVTILSMYVWVYVGVCACDVYVFAFLKVKLHLVEDLLQAVRYNGGGFR